MPTAMKSPYGISALLALLAIVVAAPTVALADKRIALVIGNSAYQHVPALPDPFTDARSMAYKFRQVGFDTVNEYFNVDQLQFKRALRDFEDRVADADVAVIYYSGYGVESRGVNYLVPVDAKIAIEGDLQDETTS